METEGEFTKFHEALNKAWAEAEAMKETNPKIARDIGFYYMGAKKQIEQYPEEAAKTLALGLARKTKLIEKWL